MTPLMILIGSFFGAAAGRILLILAINGWNAFQSWRYRREFERRMEEDPEFRAEIERMGKKLNDAFAPLARSMREMMGPCSNPECKACHPDSPSEV